MVRSTPAGQAMVSHMVIAPAKLMAEWLGETPVWAEGASLRTMRARVVVTVGCEGLEWCLLSAAAVLSWNASWPSRVVGLLLLPIAMLAANDLRIACLLRVIEMNPAYFNWLHATVAPLLLGGFAAVAFSWWVRSLGQSVSLVALSGLHLGRNA